MKPRISAVAPLSLLLAVFAFAAPTSATAQDQSASMAGHTLPPNILVINTEYVKPQSLGSAHAKTESAIAQALRGANSNAHYLGLESLTGRSRAVFLQGYGSFADWQKTTDGVMQNASLASSLDADAEADGALLNEYMTSVYHFRKNMSLNPGADLGQTRFFELTVFHVRPGHEKDWDTVVKFFCDAEAKIPGDHWDMFEKMYGENTGGTWLLAIPMKSLAHEDMSMGIDARLKDIVGADQLQKMQDLAEATVDSVVSNLFAVNPKMSYMPSGATQEDPTFWGQ